MATLQSPVHVHRGRVEFRSSRWDRLFRALERSPWKTLGALSALYFITVVTLASIRTLWFDELITYYIARINSVRGIWESLSRASDPNPPLIHILVMWSMRLFGGGELAVRLPAILAAFVGVASLFLFLRKRVPVAYAASGVLFFMSTRAFDYSYESRSYALMLGFAMLSLVLWRETAESDRKTLSAAGLALTLAAGLSSNYYCVLAFFPVAAGELVRTIEHRRIEFRAWLALAIGALPLFLYLPLINAAVAHFGPYAWNKPTTDFITQSYKQMSGEMIWLMLALIDAVIVIYFYQRAKEGRPDDAVLPKSEAAAVLTLIAYPVLAYIIAVVRAGMVSPRFVLPFCYGLSILFTVAAYRVFRRHAPSALVILAICFSWALARNIITGNDLLLENAAFDRVIKSLPSEGTLVVSDSLLALPLAHYAPKAIASRIVFPFDLKAIRKYKGEDSPEQNLWAGRDHLPLRLVSISSLSPSDSHFYFIGTRDDWFQKLLSAEHVPFRQLPIDSDSGDLWEFFPLSHGSIFVYETGDGDSSNITVPGIDGTQ